MLEEDLDEGLICRLAAIARVGPSVEEFMAEDVGRDQLALIRIEGMHCHKCQQSIQRALLSHEGVREVEVDFASGQASVLFERGSVTINELMDAVNDAGYRAVNFTQGQAGRAAH